jgi:GAF domain-containing protein
MRPIKQTIEAVASLSRYTGQGDLLDALQHLANRVQQVVPDCMGISLGWAEHGVTFTLVATAEEIAVLDALQYFAGGPCVDAVDQGHGIETGSASPLDEEQWRLFAQGTASVGVRSTLTLPLTETGRVIGTVNLYGASPHAFDEHHDELADIHGAWAPGAIRNADLSFSTRRVAEQAPGTLRGQEHVVRAVGMIGAQEGIDTTVALQRLEDAASRAGIQPAQLAEALVALHG